MPDAEIGAPRQAHVRDRSGFGPRPARYRTASRSAAATLVSSIPRRPNPSSANSIREQAPRTSAADARKTPAQARRDQAVRGRTATARGSAPQDDPETRGSAAL